MQIRVSKLGFETDAATGWSEQTCNLWRTSAGESGPNLTATIIKMCNSAHFNTATYVRKFLRKKYTTNTQSAEKIQIHKEVTTITTIFEGSWRSVLRSKGIQKGKGDSTHQTSNGSNLRSRDRNEVVCFIDWFKGRRESQNRFGLKRAFRAVLGVHLWDHYSVGNVVLFLVTFLVQIDASNSRLHHQRKKEENKL